mmetsp:Transcript_22644/g.58238  ORF Transcript_22644/g.58238 Transcript_22644/m.58238 type:complete len:150 (-) Transcript_22644:186-635(-)|eukprot:CAMPEP_0119411690 /NCGR_PEP_ID=MMETSP1335-20130426/4358_1 /TAXON_ID=259385 /ORGANISM="Chrysoculter rhomboideus, Strain RCC1486" /LENGTH=149 /DNA_ID=CAMNT_0007436355 /DNA_START=70 /DNA_END=519 /DNA_ORIENTATION=-
MVSAEGDALREANVHTPANRGAFEPSTDALRSVLESTGADYAIYWRHDTASDRLVHDAQLNSPKHLNAMRRAKEVTFSPGEGTVVGRTFQSQQPDFLRDARTADPVVFSRIKFAKNYGICSIAFVPFVDGVLEYGTRSEWETAPPFVAD